LARRYGLDPKVTEHLTKAYGDKVNLLAEILEKGHETPLANGLPYLEAEVVYAVRYELAERAMDVLARRTPLALLDTAAAKIAAPRVVELMASELGWDTIRRLTEKRLVEERLNTAI
jgi:glycerol-3-phosphate dehydrogenase